MDLLSLEIKKYESLVRILALRIAGPNSNEQLISEFIVAGMEGVWLALKNHDATQGATLDTYMRIKINSCIRDYARDCDYLTRGLRRECNEGIIEPPIAYSYNHGVDDSDENALDNVGSNPVTPLDYAIADEIYKTITEELERHPFSVIAKQNVKGDKVLDIAKAHGVTSATSSQRFAAVRKVIARKLNYKGAFGQIGGRLNGKRKPKS